MKNGGNDQLTGSWLVVNGFFYLVSCHRDELKSCLAHCEAVIDFGDDEREDDVDDSVMWALSPKVEYLCTEIKRYLNDNHRGEIIRGGVRIGLIGPPNAGNEILWHVYFFWPQQCIITF